MGILPLHHTWRAVGNWKALPQGWGMCAWVAVNESDLSKECATHEGVKSPLGQLPPSASTTPLAIRLLSSNPCAVKRGSGGEGGKREEGSLPGKNMHYQTTFMVPGVSITFLHCSCVTKSCVCGGGEKVRG